MTERHGWFKFNRYVGEGYKRLLFADLVETSFQLRYLRAKREVPTPWPNDITFRLEGDGVEDVPYQVHGWFLVSERLKALVEGAELTGITFYPIRTESRLTVPAPRYWYGHLAIVDDAIDLNRSIYGPSEVLGKIFGRIFLKPEVAKDWDFLRTAESKASIFCSNRFRHLFLSNNCTGLGFIPA